MTVFRRIVAALAACGWAALLIVGTHGSISDVALIVFSLLIVAIFVWALWGDVVRDVPMTSPGPNHPANRRIVHGPDGDVYAKPYTGPTPGTLGDRYVTPKPDDGMWAFLAVEIFNDPDVGKDARWAWRRHDLLAGRLDGVR